MNDILLIISEIVEVALSKKTQPSKNLLQYQSWTGLMESINISLQKAYLFPLCVTDNYYIAVSDFSVPLRVAIFEALPLVKETICGWTMLGDQLHHRETCHTRFLFCEHTRLGFLKPSLKS